MNETYSTISRIQNEILAVLPRSGNGLNVANLKQATKTGRTRPVLKEDWNRQFEIALTGLLIRGKVGWKARLLTREEEHTK